MAKNASVSSGSGLIRETVSMTDSFQYVRPAGGVRSTAGETVKLMSRPTTGATGRPTWNDTYVLPVDDQRTSSASQSPFPPAVAPQVRTEVLPLWGLYRVSWKDPWHFSCSLSKCCGILTVENNFYSFFSVTVENFLFALHSLNRCASGGGIVTQFRWIQKRFLYHSITNWKG